MIPTARYRHTNIMTKKTSVTTKQNFYLHFRLLSKITDKLNLIELMKINLSHNRFLWQKLKFLRNIRNKNNMRSSPDTNYNI